MKKPLKQDATFFEYLMHDSKAVTAVAIIAFVVFTAQFIAAQDNGHYEANTSMWLWLGFGLFLPLLIAFKLVQGYRDHQKGRSR